MSQTNKFTYYFTHQDGGRVYCSGFNEEGFLITNRGIQDLSTGDTVQLDSIGAPDVSLQPESGEDDATETVKGIVEIASEQECIDSINGENLDPSDTGATRVVDVEDLEKIKDVIVGSVEQEIKVLPDELSVVFVHKDVKRDFGDEAAQNTPTEPLPVEVIRAFNDVGYKPGASNTAPELVAFRSVRQVFAFINGRAPVGEDKLTVYLIGKSSNDREDGKTIKITANKRTVIRGYNQDRTGDVCVSGGKIIHGSNSAKLSIFDCTISIGDDDIETSQAFGIDSSALAIELRNCVIRVRTNQRGAHVIAQKDAPEIAECAFDFTRNEQTEILLDGVASGPDNSPYQTIALSFRNLVIKCGAKGSNTALNKLIWKFANTDPGNNEVLRVDLRSINMRLDATESDPDRQNGRLKWIFDFTGHRGDKYLCFGPTQPSALTVNDKTTVDFSCEVINTSSNLNDVKLFTSGTVSDPAAFIPIDDYYRVSRSAAAPNANGEMGAKYLTSTVTGQITKAFQDALPGGSDVMGMRIHPTCLYNGVYFTNDMGPIEYPGDVTREVEYTVDTYLSEDDEEDG
jgi:hypothetical protein